MKEIEVEKKIPDRLKVRIYVEHMYTFLINK